MTALCRRARQDEQMDSPDLDPAVYRSVLRDLAHVNRWTLAARPTLGYLDRCTRRGDRIRVLDVGFGHGDTLRAIARWAERRGVEAELTGIDINPNSRPVALAATPPALGITLVTGDYRDIAGPFDFIISSLVAHHMEDDDLVRFIRWTEKSACRGWLINDLHRHRAAYLSYPVLARILRVHRIVREDGRLSIARAFRPAEWAAVLHRAGLPPQAVSIRRWAPFRLCVERLF